MKLCRTPLDKLGYVHIIM